jgi:osmotically inducible lipoprotein OsmB
MKLKLALACAAVTLSSGCAIVLDERQVGTATGAVVGGAVGHTVTGGSTVGTIGGAAIGAVLGSDIGHRARKERRRTSDDD